MMALLVLVILAIMEAPAASQCTSELHNLALSFLVEGRGEKGLAKLLGNSMKIFAIRYIK